MNNIHILHTALSLPRVELPHLKALRIAVRGKLPPELHEIANQSLSRIIKEYNDAVISAGLGENCLVKSSDSVETIRKRCKTAFRHGLHHYPMRYVYAVSNSPLASGLGEENNPYDSPDYSTHAFNGKYVRSTSYPKKPLTLKYVDDESGAKRDEEEYQVSEVDSSTKRVRRYYKRHPEKVKRYLKKTVKDRAARNRDRAKAIKKYGKSKMKNHDVHHPNGARNGNWRLADKDHGRDTKAMKKAKRKPTVARKKEPKKRATPVAKKPSSAQIKMQAGIQILDKLVRVFIELLVYLQKIQQQRQDLSPDQQTTLQSKDVTFAEIKSLLGNKHVMQLSEQTSNKHLTIIDNTMKKLGISDNATLFEFADEYNVNRRIKEKVFQLIEGILLETTKEILINTKLLLEANDSNDLAETQKMVMLADMYVHTKNLLLLEQESNEKLKTYPHTRDYTDEELENEVGEYFENKKTKNIFPNLAKNKETLGALIKKAPSKVLEVDELLTLKNSDIQEVLTADDPREAAKQVAARHKRDIDSLKDALQDGKELPQPIVIQYKGGKYLLAGNTRLILLAASGLTMPVKLLNYEYEPEFSDVDNSEEKEDKQKKKIDTGLFKRILQMKIRNPETGNMIKIDSAMDYNRNHPAHRLALATIRHYMKGISSRAGVAKNRGL